MRSAAIAQPQAKSWVVTMLLCLLLGYLGIHRFYTGHILTGLLMLFTFGGFGIWWAIDFILILVGAFNDGDGLPLAK